jgi:hypothetical protein
VSESGPEVYDVPKEWYGKDFAYCPACLSLAEVEPEITDNGSTASFTCSECEKEIIAKGQ